MRRIYDGKFVNETGSGVSTNWHGRLSVMAGVTEKIYPALAMFGAMGERFLLWEFVQPNDREVAEMASKNLDDNPAKAEMQVAFAEFLNNLPDSETTTIDETTRKQIVDLSVFVCKARTQVERKQYHRDNPIMQVYKPEQPPRMVKQILGFGLGLQALNGGQMTDSDRHILCKMALDSIPSIRRKCLQTLTLYTEGVTTRGLAGAMKYPVDTVLMHLQDLAAVNVIDYLTATNRDRWRIKDECRSLMEVYEGLRPIGDILEEETPVAEAPPMAGENVETVEI